MKVGIDTRHPPKGTNSLGLTSGMSLAFALHPLHHHHLNIRIIFRLQEGSKRVA